MNEIKKFINETFGEIRTMNIDGKPYFMATDIAISLGYAKPNNAIIKHCRATLKRGIPISGKIQDVNFIPEGDVYRLIIKSRLPKAQEFESWLVEEVLPQIRQTGGYIPVVEDEPNEVFLARAVQVANETLKQKDAIIANQKKRISSLEETEKDWKILADTSDSITINEIAHFLGVGEYTLFREMREIGILFRNKNNDNVPYENAINKNKFFSVPVVSTDGKVHLQTRVTPTGIFYLARRLRKSGFLHNLRKPA